MSTQVMSANDILQGYTGGDQIYVNPSTKLKYTEGVRDITQKTESYWFLDLIASYQDKLKNAGFQVWKLEREYSFTVVDGVRVVGQRKDSFNVVCEDGNDNVLIKQHIHFSEFTFDNYIVWCIEGVVLLPVEY